MRKIITMGCGLHSVLVECGKAGRKRTAYKDKAAESASGWCRALGNGHEGD